MPKKESAPSSPPAKNAIADARELAGAARTEAEASQEAAEELDDELSEALEATFPGSDPVAMQSSLVSGSPPKTPRIRK
jgi:hypothetical protein